jgi:hypothetical protein
MPGSLKDLLQHLLRAARVQASHIQRTLVWLWRSTSNVPTGTRRRHHVARHRRGNGSWNRVCILWNDNRRQRWRWHVGGVSLSVSLRGFKPRGSRRCRWRWRERSGWRRSVFSHLCRIIPAEIGEGSFSTLVRCGKEIQYHLRFGYPKQPLGTTLTGRRVHRNTAHSATKTRKTVTAETGREEKLLQYAELVILLRRRTLARRYDTTRR